MSSQNIFDQIRPPDTSSCEQDASKPATIESLASAEEEEFAAESIKDSTEESKKITLENAQLRNDLNREEIEDRKQNRKERQKYAHQIFCLVAIWLYGLAIIIMMDGAKMLDINDNVQIAIITGTTIDVIGLMAIVVWYLFPNENNKPRSKNKSPQD